MWILFCKTQRLLWEGTLKQCMRLDIYPKSCKAAHGTPALSVRRVCCKRSRITRNLASDMLGCVGGNERRVHLDGVHVGSGYLYYRGQVRSPFGGNTEKFDFTSQVKSRNNPVASHVPAALLRVHATAPSARRCACRSWCVEGYLSMQLRESKHAAIFQRSCHQLFVLVARRQPRQHTKIHEGVRTGQFRKHDDTATAVRANT